MLHTPVHCVLRSASGYDMCIQQEGGVFAQPGVSSSRDNLQQKAEREAGSSKQRQGDSMHQLLVAVI